MPLDFKQNFFELFSLPVQYSLDKQLLAKNFRTLQTEYHPDRFANGNEQERRIAVQSTGYINEANETLKSPRLRARYLLTLHQVDFDDERDTTHDMHFLMDQMEKREALESAAQSADPLDAVDTIAKQVKQEQDEIEAAFAKHLAEKNLVEAKEAVLKMKFYERLANEVKSLQEKLEDEIFA
ncbi:MAG: Fe-S protein assembly co-chaperone HscB [Aquificaceae bacterium]|nr:MAG: Fe-S protein assembly co-chaperone HscB [Aquificaceae bacterium]